MPITLVSKSHHSREVRDELISPPKCHPVSLAEIKERVDKIKRRLFVTPEQKSHIEEQTRDQADCKAWYRHRKPRVTALKCKRAFIKPTTSPTKAMKEIMGMNSTVGTSFMKDRQLSEHGIIEKLVFRNQRVASLKMWTICFCKAPLPSCITRWFGWWRWTCRSKEDSPQRK